MGRQIVKKTWAPSIYNIRLIYYLTDGRGEGGGKAKTADAVSFPSVMKAPHSQLSHCREIHPQLHALQFCSMCFKTAKPHHSVDNEKINKTSRGVNDPSDSCPWLLTIATVKAATPFILHTRQNHSRWPTPLPALPITAARYHLVCCPALKAAFAHFSIFQDIYSSFSICHIAVVECQYRSGAYWKRKTAELTQTHLI